MEHLLLGGTASGVSKEFLYEINSHLRIPDISILFDGERFIEGIESGHKHEMDNDLTNKVRQTHLEIGKELGWHVVNANGSIEEVHKKVLEVVKKLV